MDIFSLEEKEVKINLNELSNEIKAETSIKYENFID